jgi:hypothetical protein
MATSRFSPACAYALGRRASSPPHSACSTRVAPIRETLRPARKKDADAYRAKVRVEVGAGVHTPDSARLTIAEAGDAWIKTCEANGLERATIATYRLTVRLHVVPYLGKLRLAQLSAPMMRQFEDKLREDGRSPTTVRIARKPGSTNW